MALDKVTSASAPTANQAHAVVSKSTRRFGRKLESKINKLGFNIPETFRGPDHQKFKNVSGEIQEESPEVAALRKTLSQ